MISRVLRYLALICAVFQIWLNITYLLRFYLLTLQVELAALLHDIGFGQAHFCSRTLSFLLLVHMDSIAHLISYGFDLKTRYYIMRNFCDLQLHLYNSNNGTHYYLGQDPSEGQIVEDFLVKEGVNETIRSRILGIIKGMGFKEEVAGVTGSTQYPEFGVVQDADRLDAIGAIGIARCFTFGGRRNSMLYDPNIKPRPDLSKEKYMSKEEQTTVNHFHEKLLKLKELMKTKAGQKRAERRHKFMEGFLEEFYQEWDGRA
ncbi:metal-dependent phosphohydrolase [Striga asiatica]|uniref:Metal-dependent phosphohydrolase n=1 Tax=Striga asiatica TaxID=4170 RepID=A0A5A7PK98_STRAF|nr:metal-dependent phosphohydrolase [Striga asiatica]